MVAYSEMYLYDVIRNLGEAFEYAINDCHISPNEFYDLFLVSGIAKQIEIGNPKYLVGMSGVELVLHVFDKVGLEIKYIAPKPNYFPSPQYWAGWSLAYYQWSTNKSFAFINDYIKLEEIIEMYNPLHEASEEKFVDVMDEIIRRKNKSYLQLLRKEQNYSQLKLSEETGVSLRMIQQYEQGVKDINKASASSLYNISKVLGCNIKDLLNDEK